MVHGLRLAELEDKIELLERDKRRNVIVMEGVQESEDKPSPEIVEEFFADLKLDLDTTACDRVYRRGKAPPGPSNNEKPEVVDNNKQPRGPRRPRPIIVSFKQFSDKIRVYKHLRNLQGLDKWDKVFISDDLTEVQQRQLRDLKSLAAYARSQGCNSTVKANCIVLENRKYAYRDLHKLPADLTLEKAKTVVCLDGGGVAFQSEHSPLSNLYPCNVAYRGRVFLSAEGALQHTRALICGKLAEANAIQYERNAYEVKRIAGSLGFSPEWERVVVEILMEILIIKFKTNELCRTCLLETGQRKLFEATGDRVWACGLPLAKIHELKLPTPGKKRTGEALEKVRSTLNAK